MHGSWINPLIPLLYPTDSEQELLIVEDISLPIAEGNSIMRCKGCYINKENNNKLFNFFL